MAYHGVMDKDWEIAAAVFSTRLSQILHFVSIVESEINLEN